MPTMPDARPIRMTEAEYLAFENASEHKHELIDGYIYDMAGNSEDHSTICSNIITSLNIQVRKRPCKVHGSDLRVRPSQKTSFSIPMSQHIVGKPNSQPKIHRA